MGCGSSNEQAKQKQDEQQEEEKKKQRKTRRANANTNGDDTKGVSQGNQNLQVQNLDYMETIEMKPKQVASKQKPKGASVKVRKLGGNNKLQGGGGAGVIVQRNQAMIFDTSKKKEVQRIRVSDEDAIVEATWHQLAQETFRELNKIRENPRSITEVLVERARNFDNNNVLKRKGQLNIKTKEGPQAVEILLEFLETHNQLEPLQWDDGLAQAAYDHAVDIGSKGLFGQLGSDHSQPFDRIERYGTWDVSVRENYAYSSSTGLEAILQMLIDDGVTSRANRVNLMSNTLKKVGISCYEHTVLRKVYVITFAQEFDLEEGKSLPGRPKEAEFVGAPALANLLPQPQLNFDSNFAKEEKMRELDQENDRIQRNQEIFQSYPAGSYGILSFEVFEFINILRNDPTALIADLEKIQPYFKGNLLVLPNRPPRLTFEGQIGVQKAIKFLRLQNKVDPLDWNDTIVQTAFEQAEFLGKTGVLTHLGEKGSNPGKRISKYGFWSQMVGESVNCDAFTARELVMRMIIDDGCGSQTHRNNIFHPSFRLAGVSCHPHQYFDLVCVVKLAITFEELEDLQLEDREYQFQRVIIPPIQNVDLSNYTVPSILPNVDLDPDKPPNAIQLRVTQMTQIENGQQVIITKQTYTLIDGQEKILIKEDKQRIK